MKTKYHLLYIAALSIGLASCNKQLNTSPSDAVSEEIILKNIGNLNTISEGAWASFMDDFYGGTFGNPGFKTIALVSDAMGSDVAVNPNKYSYNPVYSFNQLHDKTTSRVNAIWNQLYKIINNQNIILANVDKVEGDAGLKRVAKGQALAQRANIYLTIASFYQFSYLKDPNAKTAPIYTEPTTDKTEGKPRATLNELYTQILKDLGDAIPLLDGYQRTAKYKIDTNVVFGLQARAYLNTGKWDEAATAASKALKYYPLMTQADYTQGFNDVRNSEWIWGHSEIPSQSDGSYSFHFLDVSSASSYYYSFSADPFFMLLFNDGDIRKSLFSWDGRSGRQGFLQYKKFRFRDDQTADLVLMRSAEAHLIKAEGLARADKKAEAVQALNDLRNARGATPADPAISKDDLIKEILIERRKELWGEGFSLSDIIRNQQAVSRKPYVDADKKPIVVTAITPDGTPIQVPSKSHTSTKFIDGSDYVPNSPYYLFAIPLAEEQNNPNLYK
ncbi:RagB/SusD family nutrient uptake outer membrane protein [Pseudoflavitalea sp. G-6-1-2]|uniref:RagB/SusD family nutrient uptake outer membrane protein n=1 Tax=Pseudoflavitalea sp. G-6-1-2 TaxID=2728841 RepID=UPI00146F2BCE|nr:RagB/SusD family nutrient uptake outer membrane protein [Pseudoflavitalea sp. G-6-1-2]NML23359.1 RagB/SusD family nutrient uptake outer membrane protein [Pseudoflavitalea sp. G-6-1-2]